MEPLTSLIEEVLATARQVVDSGVLSLSGHGNVSIYSPERGLFAYTAAPTLRGIGPSAVVTVDLDGGVLSGTLPPLSRGAVDMHRTAYRERPGLGCVIHTHSPFATAYAVAGRPIECWVEPLSIFGMEDGVPVVPYAERGSPAAMEAIAAGMADGARAVLLQSHGILAFGETGPAAVQVSTLVEEAAQLGINAEALGGVTLLPGAGTARRRV